MTTEQVIQMAARLRRLTDEEFQALEELVMHGRESPDERLLGPALDALADCAAMARE